MPADPPPHHRWLEAPVLLPEDDHARRALRRFGKFYLTYSGIRKSLTPELRALLAVGGHESANKHEPGPRAFSVDPKKLVSRLSFIHFAELIWIDDPLKRYFYEAECMRGNWSKRELKR